jgi:hypothetical protein
VGGWQASAGLVVMLEEPARDLADHLRYLGKSLVPVIVRSQMN